MADELDDDLPGEPVSKPATPAKKPPVAVEPEPERKPVPERQVHQHTQRLVNIATQLGFSKADLDNHPSSVIWEEVHRIQELMAAQQRPTTATPVTPKPEVDEDEEYLNQMAANPEVDPKFVKVLKRALKNEKGADLEKKLAKLEALEAAEQQRAVRHANDSMDTAFEALGKKYEHLVGVGAMADLKDPGERGWRGEIFKQAKVDFTKDSQRTINRKVLEVASALAADKIANDEPEEEVNEYEAAAKKKPTPAKDPETGRFTAADFERGAVARPSGKKSPVTVNGVEVLRQHFKENGDPRGNRGYGDPDDDSDLPG